MFGVHQANVVKRAIIEASCAVRASPRIWRGEVARRAARLERARHPGGDLGSVRRSMPSAWPGRQPFQRRATIWLGGSSSRACEWRVTKRMGSPHIFFMAANGVARPALV